MKDSFLLRYRKGSTRIVDDFWAHCMPVTETGCWLWLRNTRGKGYGSFNKDKEHPNYYAHRYAWEITNKAKIPKGMVVCHKCDTPSCINPDHLFLGTYFDNHHDMHKKRRGKRSRKLSDQDLLDIYFHEGPRGCQVELARKYGVCKQTITLIKQTAPLRLRQILHDKQLAVVPNHPP